MKKLNLNENFISRIWAEKMYYSGLKTTDGKNVEILDYGIRNKDSGADFRNARINIGGNIFKGDIEIHRSKKDWFLHMHKGDDKYNKVILQVVFWEDEFSDENAIPKVSKSRIVPTVILSKFLTKSIHEIWKEIIENPSSEFKLPCWPENGKVDNEIKKDWIKKLSLKRLEYRSGRINSRLNAISEQTGSPEKKANWEKLFFEFTLEALGFSKNKEQFLRFAEILDYNKIKKYPLQKEEPEALFFGTSGLLSGLKYRDEYISRLKSTWEEIKETYKPQVMNKAEWNFFRLRPQNFPTIRMAYAVSLFRELVHNDFFKRAVLCFENSKSIKKDISGLFLGIRLTGYWSNHYVFGRQVKTEIKSIGEERVRDIVTNVVLPLLFLYSEKFNRNLLKEKVLHYYLATKEKNKNEVTKIMQVQTGISAATVSENQGLIHLHNFYCVEGKCKDCAIGGEVLKAAKDSELLRIILY
ncbi:MAG: DUF2851 family protein [Ignavibacteriae bacterium]|nr:DUF2851 family protein [Ignavibacteriota bacterium]